MIKFRNGLIKKLIDLGYDTTVVSPYDKHIDEILLLGAKYKNINIENKGSNPFKDFKLIFDLKKIYHEISPDLIIHYTIKPNIYGTLAARLVGIKSISFVSGLGYAFINRGIISIIAKKLYRFSFRFPSKVIFINQDDLNTFVNSQLVNYKKTLLFPGEGINTDIFTPTVSTKSNSKFQFLLIARMLWDKGVSEYVEAAKKLKITYPNIEFALLGYLDVANPKAISREQMDSWVEKKIVQFYGSTDDVKTYISNADCIVLPSYREGLSMTLMESASMCKPIIATNVAGCKDVVDHGINGFLCEVKNAEDLAEKMEMMLQLSEYERKAMGEAGRAKMINEFDESIVIGKYLKVLKQL